jgi:hypothetical protein
MLQTKLQNTIMALGGQKKILMEGKVSVTFDMVSARLISSFFSIGVGSIIALMNISLEISNQYQIKNLNSLELPTNQILTTNLNNISISISLLPH